jgi:hypothetical protein
MERCFTEKIIEIFNSCYFIADADGDSNDDELVARVTKDLKTSLISKTLNK